MYGQSTLFTFSLRFNEILSLAHFFLTSILTFFLSFSLSENKILGDIQEGECVLHLSEINGCPSLHLSLAKTNNISGQF
jgi:hypothetical protein